MQKCPAQDAPTGAYGDVLMGNLKENESTAKLRAFVLKDWPYRPGLEDIAKLAIQLNLDPQEALVEIRDAHHLLKDPGPVSALSVSILASKLCQRGGGIPMLEYTDEGVLVTRTLLGSKLTADTTIATDNDEYGRAVRILFPDITFSTLKELASSPATRQYATIVANCNFDLITLGQEGGRGGRGEVVRLLADRVAPKGMLLWITFRSVIGSEELTTTCEGLKACGLDLMACVESPYFRTGTPEQGAVFVFQRAPVADVLVADLRDNDGAERLASAILSGSKKHGPNWFWIKAEEFRTYSEEVQNRRLKV